MCGILLGSDKFRRLDVCVCGTTIRFYYSVIFVLQFIRFLYIYMYIIYRVNVCKHIVLVFSFIIVLHVITLLYNLGYFIFSFKYALTATYCFYDAWLWLLWLLYYYIFEFLFSSMINLTRHLVCANMFNTSYTEPA